MKERPLPKGTILHSKQGKKVFSGVRFDVYHWNQKQFDGTEAVYETVKRKDTVSIIPVIGEEVILVNEEQPHWGAKKLCIIAGGAEENEDLEEAARRELLEETGMVFKDFYLVAVDRMTTVEWFLYTFIAKGYVEIREKKLDPGERNEVMKISFDKLVQSVKEEKFIYTSNFIEKFLIKGDTSALFDALKNPEKYSIK